MEPHGIEVEGIVGRLQEIRPWVYLATPYSKYPHGTNAAFREACKIAGWLLKRGVHVFCPIAHTHPIAKESGMPLEDHGIWLPADRPFMEASGGIVVAMMDTWELSYGISFEVEEFRGARKPVYFLRWPREDAV